MQATCPKEWGALAVIWDKNEMEATGYASVMADLCNENILLAEYRDTDQDPPVKWVDGTSLLFYLSLSLSPPPSPSSLLTNGN